MSDSASFATSLLGRKAQLKQNRGVDPAAATAGEIVCIHQDNGGNLRFTLLGEDGSLVCVTDKDLRILK